VEPTHERKKCFMRYFDYVDVRRQVNIKLANFLVGRKYFADVVSLSDRSKKKSW